ncbi:MAG: flagellar basal body rod protein FlgC [Candidatus Auribacterota bacterium]
MSDTFSSFHISASGLSAERMRMNIISNNLANANTTNGSGQEPYSRKMVLFKEVLADTVDVSNQEGQGVAVDRIIESKAPFKRVYDPAHPDADKDGFVSFPNVNPVEEMVDMITATRAYEANVAAFNAAKSMAIKALEMGQ